MNRRVTALLKHDLAVAFKNKTLYLVACIPIFVYATMMMVDTPESRGPGAKIALLQSESYAPAVLDSIQRAPDLFAVRRVSNEAEAIRLLKARELAGYLTHAVGSATQLQLTVIQQSSVESLIVQQRFSALQIAAEGKGPGWIAAVRSLQTNSIQQQSLPTWILMMVLLVSFIVLPAQVAEEKEKQLLLGWLQTPVREGEWLVSKLVYGVVLMIASLAVLHAMGGEPVRANGAAYLAMLCAGGFCFGALGICLGLLCRTQASARTLGLLCYLPMLLPAALSDTSQKLRSFAAMVPSYHFYEPIRAMLLEDCGLGAFARAWTMLVAIGVLACLVSHQLIRKRWLM